MSDNWIVQNLENALETWNEKLAEIWQLITTSPQNFKGGNIWSVIVNINGAVQAIGLALLVLFFVVGMVRTCGSFSEVKKPEHALKLFVRFALAKGAITYGMELMLALFNIGQGIITTIMNSAGFGTPQGATLPSSMITTIEDCGFFESIPLWAVTLIGGLFITVLSFIMIMTVYGRFFKLYMYAALAPIPLSTFAGEPSQNVGKSFIKSYCAVLLEGAVIVLACIIFSVFASSPPTVDTNAAAVTQVWAYIGELMFVCANRNIAYSFYKIVIELRPEWAEKKICADGAELTEKDKKELKPIEKIRMVMTRNKDDEPELYEMLGTKEDRKELDRQFKNVKSNFKIAIVVDMWLTGFDVPALDTIYIDKPIQQHTLIQTISRVNRVYEGKDKGLIVDYIGIKKNMNMALKKYTNFETEEFEGVEQSITIVKDQLEVLAQMFHNFNSKDFFCGSPVEQLACLNRAVEYVQLTEELETRFMAAVKRMKQAFNLCSSSEKFTDDDKDHISFYCAVRSILFKLTKGDAPDTAQMNARVRELLEGAIQSDGIEELFETGKHISVDIFSDEYMDKINAIQLPNTKIKLLQRLLSQAIEEYKKVNRIMSMEFAERMKRVVDEYNNRRKDEAFANEVLDDVAEQLAKLLEDLKKEKDSFKDMGIDYEEKAFYDILNIVARKYEFEYPDDKMIELSKRIKLIVDDKARYTDWSTRDDIKANLQVDLILLLDEFDYPPVTIDDVYKEVLEQAENFKKYAN